MRLKKIIFYLVWLIVLWVLQPTAVQWIDIFGICPNLFLVFVITIAFFAEKKDVVICGAIFGFVYDLIVGRHIGVSALMFMYLGLGTAFVADRFLYNSRSVTSAIVNMTTSLIYALVYYISYLIEWRDMGVITAFFRIILPEVLYNGAIGFLAFVPIKKMYEHIKPKTMF